MDAPGAALAAGPAPTGASAQFIEHHGSHRITVAVPAADASGSPAGIVVFDVGADPSSPAAVELWDSNTGLAPALTLRRGWYSDAAAPMARFSSHTRFARGAGLPGMAWQLQSPAYLGRLSSSELFLRSYSASQVGLQHGLAIPAADGGAVILLLAGHQQPIARRVELAAVGHGGIRSLCGHCQRDGDLFSPALKAPCGAALIESCARSGRPSLTRQGAGHDIDGWLAALGATALLTWPFLADPAAPVVLALWL